MRSTAARSSESYKATGILWFERGLASAMATLQRNPCAFILNIISYVTTTVAAAALHRS
jgi:hypothetical protein